MTNNEYFDINLLKFNIKVVSPSGKEIEIDPLAQVIIDEENIKGQIKIQEKEYSWRRKRTIKQGGGRAPIR